VEETTDLQQVVSCNMCNIMSKLAPHVIGVLLLFVNLYWEITISRSDNNQKNQIGKQVLSGVVEIILCTSLITKIFFFF
jgi:hypothetical protein